MSLVLGFLMWMIGTKIGMGPGYFVLVAFGILFDVIALIAKILSD